MTSDEIKKAIAGLHATFPAYKPKGGWDAFLDVWVVTFSDTPKEDFRKAMGIYINSGKRLFPSATELSEILTKMGKLRKAQSKMTEAEKIAHAQDKLPTFEQSGCIQLPCPYLREGQTDFCKHCVFDRRQNNDKTIYHDELNGSRCGHR